MRQPNIVAFLRSYCGTGVARILLAALFAVSTLSDASAESIESALAHAYRTNPQLNAQRANLRNIDENVPQALSGYRPRISATADVGQQTSSIISRPQGATQTRNQQSGSTTPAGFGVTGTQTLFNGFQTANRTRAAEGQVQQGREALRVLEQQVLLDAATAYMNILRDQAIVDLQRRNVEVLDEQLRQTRDRFNVGEVTRTDVAQSESRIAAARSQLLTAQANLAISRANYFRIVGREARALNAARPVDRLLPNTLDHAIALAVSINPNVTAAQYGVDVAQLLVKVNEGVLYPVLTLEGNAQQRYESSLQTERNYTASVVTRLTVPIYQGGGEYATIRQSKETVGERRFFLAQVRDQARATLVQAWSQLQAARAQIEAAQAQVSASELALNGVREEARVGQRTTLDVLNAQQELVNARVTLVTAQRDRVVASYAVLAAIGRNTPEILKLPTELYDPMVHYQQVRDAWSGVRTPDGK